MDTRINISYNQSRCLSSIGYSRYKVVFLFSLHSFVMMTHIKLKAKLTNEYTYDIQCLENYLLTFLIPLIKLRKLNEKEIRGQKALDDAINVQIVRTLGNRNTQQHKYKDAFSTHAQRQVTVLTNVKKREKFSSVSMYNSSYS